ncbi:hypothetical protein [Bradyrhizobium sp. USDA 10063]
MNSEGEEMDGRLIRAIARAEVRTRDVEALRPEERRRIVAAVECQAQLADAALRLQERQVAALEALVACVQKRGRA